MRSSIAVATVAVGPTYLAYLPRWATAIAELERQPDQIVIVTDHMPDDIKAALDELIPSWMLVISNRIWKHHPQVLINDAISMTSTEWVCKMDADDVLLPHAFNQIDTITSDVLMFGIRTNEHDLVFVDVTANSILSRQHNYVFSGSPFRRWLWERNHFRDMIFEDWAFWIGCATQGARFKHSETIDYIYTQHPNQISSTIDTAYWEKVVRDVT